MEPTQGSPEPGDTDRAPRKRRHRGLIVAFVLVLATLCSWWYWPRGDARFVGKWSMNSGAAVFCFYPNGSFKMFGNDGSLQRHQRWWVKDDTMFFSSLVFEGFENGLWSGVQHVVSAASGSLHADRFQVVTPSENEVHLTWKTEKASGAVVLTRLPE